MDLIIGSKSRKSVFENNKGQATNRTLRFLLSSFSGINLMLKREGQHYISTLIAEILGNAEDHSIINRWFVNGVSFKRKTEVDKIVEINLCIMNFGYSFYEGFEKTKELNYQIYEKMEAIFSHYTTTFQSLLGFGEFDKESLFTLYALQEGISRIKYEKQSRGNGTMNFIRAFVELGSLGLTSHNEKPVLNIFSGKTSLACDDECRPYFDKSNNVWVLSLNKVSDTKKPPDSEYLKHFSQSLPGTILKIKLFLSEEYFIHQVTENVK